MIERFDAIAGRRNCGVVIRLFKVDRGGTGVDERDHQQYGDHNRGCGQRTAGGSQGSVHQTRSLV